MKDRIGKGRAIAAVGGLAALLLLAPLTGCSGGDAPGGSVPPPGPPAAFAGLFDAVLGYTVDHVPLLDDGGTIGDFGDSTAYGPATLFALETRGTTSRYAARARRMAGRHRRLIEENLWLAYPQEFYIGVIGAFLAYETTGEEVYRESVEWSLDLLNDLLDLAGELVFIIEEVPYGPTTIIGGVAMYNLQYAVSIGETPRTAEYVAHGLSLIDWIDERAYEAGEGYYRYARFQDRLSAYPNAIMITALARAYRLTGEPRYLERARVVAETVERRLLAGSQGGYVGYEDRTDRYTALSNNNYLIQALLFLAEVSGDPVYLDRANQAIAFVREHLCEPEEGICYHDLRLDHRMDWFCPGCGWQLLYNILEYRRLGGR